MNTDPTAVRVLCFGDSNTYGACRREVGVVGTASADPEYVRLDVDRRWPGRLQRLLGEGFEVIEEGLNGRTTDLELPGRPGLDGRSYFVPCLLSHRPLDVVIVMLGGNDLKPAYGRSPVETAEALGRYVDDVAAHATDARGGLPATLLVGPGTVDETAPAYHDLVGDSAPADHAARSRELAEALAVVAAATRATYVDAAQVARPGADGVHLSVESHARLAELLAATVTARLSGAPA